VTDATLPADTTAARGLTVEEAAKRYRVSPDKIRAWIKSGQLKAINTTDVACARPRFVVLPESLRDFEQRRGVGSSPKSPPKRRRQAGQIDYYAD
jgi:hypothetical protein